MSEPIRPFRFCLQVMTAADVTGVARAAEDVGYAVLHVPDHLGGPDPFVTLAAAATATRDLRLAPYVLNNEFWPLALTARAAAGVDIVSGGRLELGLGAGHMRAEFDAAGWPFHPAGRRVTHLEQDVRTLQRLLAGERVTTEGDRTTLRDHELRPLPVQDRVPILIGGNGDRVLRLAAEVADIVSFIGFAVPASGEPQLTHFTRAGLADRLGVVREAAGPRLTELERNLLVQHVEIADTRQRAVDQTLERYAGFGLEGHHIIDSPFVLAGSVDQICDELTELREETGISSLTVRALPGSPFDEVVRRLAGT